MTGRFRLFLVWFFGYAGSCFILSAYAFMMISIEDISGVLGSAIITLTGIFAPYMTPIVAFWFAKEVVQTVTPLAAGPYKVAFLCSLFYNAIFILLMGSLFLFGAPDPEYTITQILDLSGKVSTGLAFLVGPAIGFYFGKAE